MLLEVRNLTREFSHARGVFAKTQVVRALDGVSFSLRRGECLGIAGESGSGKTTLARVLLKLIPPTHGTIFYDPGLITNFRKDTQVVFQNPYASLNPRMRILETLGEPLRVHKLASRVGLRARVEELLERVGLDSTCLNRYPDEFSGGQRQRVCIARALSTQPKCLILDEPVSSLDLTVQAQMLDLFKDLKDRFDLTYLFISHNLAILRQICDRVIIMRAGRIVEEGPVTEVFSRPRDAYTRELLEAAGMRFAG